MTANAAKFRAPYVSEMLAEPDRTYDDCAASVGIMLFADWSLGEWLVQPDGDRWPVLALRNLVRERIGDTDGGLTLHDVNDIGHELDPDLPDLPRYPDQRAKPGQSTAGATLRLDRGELKAMLQAGHSAAVCGLAPNGVGHVIHVTDGNSKGVLRKDPLTRNPPGWSGDRISWDSLWAFTEATRNGERVYGSTNAIACAVVQVGAETQAERRARQSRALVEKLRTDVAGANAATGLARQAVDDLTAKLKAATARITELENAAPPPADCTAATAAAREQALSDAADALAALRVGS